MNSSNTGQWEFLETSDISVIKVMDLFLSKEYLTHHMYLNFPNCDVKDDLLFKVCGCLVSICNNKFLLNMFD